MTGANVISANTMTTTTMNSTTVVTANANVSGNLNLSGAIVSAGGAGGNISGANVISANTFIAGSTSGNATGSLASINTFGFKNRLINGAMVIDQRNAGASVSATGGGQYFVDRWACGISAGSKFTVQQSSTAPTGFNNSSLITSSTAWSVGATDYATYYQYIEGYNIADLGFGTAGASTVTLSFWVRSSLTGTFGGTLSNSTNRFYPFTYTISTANTWEQKTVTIAGDTTGTWQTTTSTGISVLFSLAAGSSLVGTANAWTGVAAYQGATGQTNILATNAATWYVTGVQLEKGNQATPFDFRPYGTEFQLCQRYYQAPCGTSTSGIGQGGIGTFYAVTTSEAFNTINFPVPMRATPTVTFYNGAGVSGGAHGLGSAGDITGVTLDRLCPQGLGRMLKISGLTAGYMYAIIFQASAEL